MGKMSSPIKYSSTGQTVTSEKTVTETTTRQSHSPSKLNRSFLNSSQTTVTDDDLGYSSYVPSMSPRKIVINRARSRSVGSLEHLNFEDETSKDVGLNYVEINIDEVKTTRNHEKKEMQELNSRLASFIDKIAFLEAKNKILSDRIDIDLKQFKEDWSTNAVIQKIEAELKQARKLHDDVNNENGSLKIAIRSLEERNDKLQEENGKLETAYQNSKQAIDRQMQVVSDFEAENNLLRRKANTKDAESKKDKAEIKRLRDELKQRGDTLNRENLNLVKSENKRHTVEEEFEYFKHLHGQRLNDLDDILSRDRQKEEDIWTKKMEQGLKKIQDSYDEQLEVTKAAYGLKSNQLENDVNQYKRRVIETESQKDQPNQEIARLREEIRAMKVKFDETKDVNLSMRVEIAAYRKLLEGAHDSVGLKQAIEALLRQYSMKQETQEKTDITTHRVITGEMQAKIKYQKEAKGPVGICDCSEDATYIVLENTQSKDEDLTGWKIKRLLEDTGDKVDFTFPNGAKVKGNSKVKVWARGYKPLGKSDDFELPYQQTWGQGSSVTTYLQNPSIEEKSTHVKRSVYNTA
ncbi:unnamed protein product [Owenia fusiformis]|uniref:Uncharacterized protein n=1 Tax=Owenia fusiformis TaxID=6347 RepID=A0A8J1UCR4_OWEFU|nr:unnamed protein product [Owenia fusiformis]